MVQPLRTALAEAPSLYLRIIVAQEEIELERTQLPIRWYGRYIREVGDTRHRIAAQFEAFRDTQVPETVRALAERSVVQTREAYEHSKIALQSVLESWNKSFGAAGQGTMALNSKIIDIAERNIDKNFDFAMSLCRAKNLAEVMELQAAYLQKQFGQLRSQAEEVRLLSTKAYVGAGALKRNQ